MTIIPVIDLKEGQVVLAQYGNRQYYQPINSPLCASADIYAVLEAFLGLYNFTTFYLADLNAITQQGHHDELIADVVARFPTINFWVDKGYQHNNQQPTNYYRVLGSECYSDTDISLLQGFNKQFILSLDYNTTGIIGAQGLLNNSALWPKDIIIMSLHRVGSFQGADIIKLNEFNQRYPENNFIAAGGIRNAADLQQLKAIGIKQVLVASALHSKAINRTVIKQLLDE